MQNSSADSGRHDFVTGSDVTGPIVFTNSTTTNTRADSGPHHRWGNGLLFDNLDINGNAINVQNRWDQRQRPRLGRRERGHLELRGQQLHRAEPADGPDLADRLDRHDQRRQLPSAGRRVMRRATTIRTAREVTVGGEAKSVSRRR